MNFYIDRDLHPLYMQLYRQLRDGIISGIFPYNSRLPSKRLLSEETGLSTITIEHAYALLCDEGYTQARERSGYYVIFRPADGFAASAPSTPADHVQIRDSDTDYPGFPVSVLSKTVRRVISERGDAILKKSPNPGCTELREAIKQYLTRNRGINVDIDRIIIGAGAEYLYRIIIELLGRDRLYAIESPSYEKLEQIYRASGAGYELLPLSGDGIDSDALTASKADVLHTTPYRSFPSGVTASASKRHEYIHWADRPGRFIIESDYGSEFSVASKPTEALFALSDRDNIIYLNTFSRTISPAIRIGYMLLPRSLVAPFYERLGFYSCTVPTLDQLVLSELISRGDLERHINRSRRQLRRELLPQHDK